MIQFEQSQYGRLDTSDLKHDVLPFAEAFAPMLAQAGYDGDGLVEVLSRSFSYVLFAEFSTRRPLDRDGRGAYRAFIHHLWNGG